MDDKKRKIPNLFKVIKDKPQHISWQHLKLNLVYDFELILPFKSIVQEINNKGGYMIICAEVLDTQETNIHEVNKGQNIIIDFAMKTFGRSWEATSYKFRQKFNDTDNLHIKFIKESRQKIKLLELDIKKPTNEHEDFADKVYNNSEEYVFKNVYVIGNNENK